MSINVKPISFSSQQLASTYSSDRLGVFNSAISSNKNPKYQSPEESRSITNRFGKASAKFIKWLRENIVDIVSRVGVLVIPIAIVFKLYGGGIRAKTSSVGLGDRVRESWDNITSSTSRLSNGLNNRINRIRNRRAAAGTP
ncbi:MAG: hypothetical protein SFU25_00980 [Candidatus Caenarcaniphilales bacterium]|nr:hypothetical protein [Candidatus Caenarcaniphilales bacterium]